MLLRIEGSKEKIQSDIDFYLRVTNRNGIKPLKEIKKEMYRSFEGSVATGSSFVVKAKDVENIQKQKNENSNLENRVENTRNEKETITEEKKEYGEFEIDEDGWYVAKKDSSESRVVSEAEEEDFHEPEEEDFNWDSWDEDDEEGNLEDDDIEEEWSKEEEEGSFEEGDPEEEFDFPDNEGLEEEQEGNDEAFDDWLDGEDWLDDETFEEEDKDLKEPNDKEKVANPENKSRLVINTGNVDDSWKKDSEVGHVKNLWSFDEMEDMPESTVEAFISSMKKFDSVEGGISQEDIKSGSMRSLKTIIKEREEEEKKEEEERKQKGLEEEKREEVVEEKVEEVQEEVLASKIDDYKSLRDFVKKNPNCSIEEALKVFSKKEIEREIRVGRVYKGRNRLFI